MYSLFFVDNNEKVIDPSFLHVFEHSFYKFFSVKLSQNNFVWYNGLTSNNVCKCQFNVGSVNKYYLKKLITKEIYNYLNYA